jgi:hypothetical protein
VFGIPPLLNGGFEFDDDLIGDALIDVGFHRAHPVRDRERVDQRHLTKQRQIATTALVPLAGLEPARCFHHLILSQARWLS